MNKDKAEQLGMNPGTARHALTRDIMFRFIVETGKNKCFQCGEPMCRETYSIEHKVPWMHSADPLGLYFDPENISFSHQSCNYSAKRNRPVTTGHGHIVTYKNGCRCAPCTVAKRDAMRRYRAQT